MTLNIASMNDNASVTSSTPSTFGGDSSEEIAQLRAKRVRIISDGRILQDEYRKILSLDGDDIFVSYGVDYDVVRHKWLVSIFEYIAMARAMYDKGKISRLHFKAMIKSLPKLETSWKVTSYFHPDLCEEFQIGYPDHVALLSLFMSEDTAPTDA